MNKNDCYIWFSGATDATGMGLRDKLKIEGGTAKPTGKKMVLCWGTKTKDAVTFPTETIVINHPDNIAQNRNKLGALDIMLKAGVAIKPFANAQETLNSLTKKNKGITLPLIGRTNYHQGGKGLWICPTTIQVKTAIDAGAQYFQELIEIKDEYRLHVFNGTLIYAVKKVKRENVKEAFIKQTEDKITHAAGKRGVKIDDTTMAFVLKQMGEDVQVDDLVRSNTRGWKFSHVANQNVPKNLIDQAIKALSALSLQFGAIDCCVDVTGNPWVIEVNTGPGLEGSTLDIYVSTIENYINSLQKTKPVQKQGENVYEIIGKGVKKVVTVGDKVRTKPDAKMLLKAKAELLAEIADVASDEEATVVSDLMARVWRNT